MTAIGAHGTDATRSVALEVDVAKRIRLVGLDVDGVLTEGGIYLANEALGTSEEEQTGVVRLKWPKELQ